MSAAAGAISFFSTSRALKSTVTILLLRYRYYINIYIYIYTHKKEDKTD